MKTLSVRRCLTEKTLPILASRTLKRLLVIACLVFTIASPLRAQEIVLPWLIGDDGGVWRQVASLWTRVGLATGTSLAVAGETAYIIGGDGQVWTDNGKGLWMVLAGGGAGTRLAADADGSLYLVAQDQGVYRYTNRGWRRLGLGLASDVAVANGIPYVIGTDGRVWCFREEWLPYNPVAKGQRLSVGSEGVFVIGIDNAVWKVTPSEVTRWGLGQAREIAVGADGYPWVIGMDGGLWRSGAEKNWSRVGLGTAKGLTFSVPR